MHASVFVLCCLISCVLNLLVFCCAAQTDGCAVFWRSERCVKAKTSVFAHRVTAVRACLLFYGRADFLGTVAGLNVVAMTQYCSVARPA